MPIPLYTLRSHIALLRDELRQGAAEAALRPQPKLATRQLRVLSQGANVKVLWAGASLLATFLLAFACRCARADLTQAADLGGTSWELVKFEAATGKRYPRRPVEVHGYL